MEAPVRVHWVRHGEVASHRGDVPVTEAGLARAAEVGRRLAGGLEPGASVHFLYTPTRRARETAAAIRDGMETAVGSPGGRRPELLQLAEEWAIRNPDLYVAGRRVEMVSTPEALAEQLGATGLGPAELAGHRFFGEFWASRDRIGYWVGHPDPPGEDRTAVARRLMAFAASLPDLPRRAPQRYVCVTHSPVLRAFVSCYLLGEDPGEPEYLEPVDVLLSGRRVEVSFRDLRKTVVGSSG